MPSAGDPERQPLPPATDNPAPGGAGLTLFQANLLVGMLGGFWGRKADGHPGPDLLGRGWVVLAALVRWERLKSQGAPSQGQGKDPPVASGVDLSSQGCSANRKTKSKAFHVQLI